MFNFPYIILMAKPSQQIGSHGEVAVDLRMLPEEVLQEATTLLLVCWGNHQHLMLYTLDIYI